MTRHENAIKLSSWLFFFFFRTPPLHHVNRTHNPIMLEWMCRCDHTVRWKNAVDQTRGGLSRLPLGQSVRAMNAPVLARVAAVAKVNAAKRGSVPVLCGLVLCSRSTEGLRNHLPSASGTILPCSGVRRWLAFFSVALISVSFWTQTLFLQSDKLQLLLKLTALYMMRRLSSSTNCCLEGHLCQIPWLLH